MDFHRSGFAGYLAGVRWGLCGIIALPFLGAFKFILPVSSPVNAECVVAVSFLLVALIRSGGSTHALFRNSANSAATSLVVFGSLLLLMSAIYFRALPSPFLFDDYGHVTMVSRSTLHDILSKFYVPQPDIFFRPLGFLSYYSDFRWAGFNPFLWHAWSLLIHTVNCVLVYVLLRQVGFEILASAFAGVIFGIHGTRAEPVAWTDARFDLLSTLFALLTLVSLEKYVAGTKRIFLAAGLLFTALAILSKESAFCIPLMVAVLGILHSSQERKRVFRAMAATFAICFAGFVYRLSMIGGIGGYQSNGHSNVLHFNPLRIVKALLWRVWGFAFFPVNWWSDTSFWIRLFLTCFLAVLAVVAFGKQVNRRRLVTALLLVIAASVPVQHLLILDAGLTGARVYYLPLLGIALFWATIVETYAGNRYCLFAMLSSVAFFNIVALEHNLSVWTDVAKKAQSACRIFGRQIEALPGRIAVTGLPYQERGVYFLTDGFVDCLAMNSNVPEGKVIVETRGDFDKTDMPNKFYWNSRKYAFERAKRTGE